ncbi:three-Cys-motif partner protein TcmP [Spirillospora sp. NPDC049652]
MGEPEVWNKMAVLWKLEPATAAKHRLYKSYLDAWWPIFLQSGPWGLRPRVTYVDAFAGPGKYLNGEDGSPVFALERLLAHTARQRMHLSRDRVCLIFVENDRARFQYLKALLFKRFGDLELLPVRVVIRHGCASDCGQILTEVGAWGHPVLAIFDSWGNVNVPLAEVAKIGHNPSSEVITTFGPNWFSRREDLNTDVLDAVFGGRSYWESADQDSRPDERWRKWLSTYRDAMHRAGFEYRLHFKVVPKTGLPLYLVYGTKHEKGVEVMKNSMWDVDHSDGMSFADPRTRGATLPGQGTLFAGGDQPELHELVGQRLAQGQTTVEELGNWLLLETARWRPRDARSAIEQMRRGGVVRVEPAGRVKKDSVVKLQGTI